jgi:hypothetical protein
MISGAVEFYQCIFVISPDDGRDRQPKHVAYMTKKWMSEHLYCCISQMILEDIKSRMNGQQISLFS